MFDQLNTPKLNVKINCHLTLCHVIPRPSESPFSPRFCAPIIYKYGIFMYGKYFQHTQQQQDELMGVNRNLDNEEGIIEDFKDERVCKAFLCGLCPHDLFRYASCLQYWTLTVSCAQQHFSRSLVHATTTTTTDIVLQKVGVIVPGFFFLVATKILKFSPTYRKPRDRGHPPTLRMHDGGGHVMSRRRTDHSSAVAAVVAVAAVASVI